MKPFYFGPSLVQGPMMTEYIPPAGMQIGGSEGVVTAFVIQLIFLQLIFSTANPVSSVVKYNFYSPYQRPLRI